MTNKEYVLETLKRSGKLVAEAVQKDAQDMSGTMLNREDMYIPDFKAAVARMNMLERPAGFICKTTAGRIVKLIQPYDSDIFKDEPENLTAQFGFVWSTEPEKARPFIAAATSPYMKGDCCEQDGKVFRSKIDNNVFSPEGYPDGWERAEK